MKPILSHRAEIEKLEGGWFIVQALLDIVKAIDTQPVYIGSNTKIQSGTGAPNNKTLGSVGDLYLRTDGGTSTTLYVKESGSNSNTGWVAK